jgi:hypothetical protein
LFINTIKKLKPIFNTKAGKINVELSVNSKLLIRKSITPQRKINVLENSKALFPFPNELKNKPKPAKIRV